MTDTEIDALLASRGYRRFQCTERFWRSWFWVEPIRDDGIPTKLCQWTCGLNPDGLHWMLDHYCELKGEYYSDEQRARTRRAALTAQEE